MYIVKTGVVRGYYYKDFQEITVSLWMENETFGDVTTYITNNPAIKSYQAIEDTELYRMDIQRFRSFFEVNHEICNLARIISERYILKSQFLSYCLIHLTAEEKYQLFLINKPGLINRVKIKHIASYLDITPETLSRIRCSEIYNQRSMVS
jgi:CRP-like cAMP-binding protein